MCEGLHHLLCFPHSPHCPLSHSLPVIVANTSTLLVLTHTLLQALITLKVVVMGAVLEDRMLLGLAAVGFLYILRLVYLVVPWFYAYFLRPAKPLSRYGEWALITGSTDGIGRAMTVELARKKINVVIVGRSPTKLDELSKELTSKYKVQVRSVVVDFMDDDLEAGLAKISQATSDIQVGILVNNVGISYPYARFLHEVDENLEKSLLRLNCETTTKMIHLFLPSMLKRKSGLIVNVGSGAVGILPSYPLYSVYAASKAYVEQLSRSLYVEYKHSGIDVQCQAPLYVATKMSKIRASFTAPSAEKYAKCALACAGYEPVITPYWVQSVMWFIIRLLPEPIMDSILLSKNLNIRRKGQAKENLAKKE
ncbi:hypothetical protein M758_UG168900 [Ceratodon purpureus]|nr:hypothetical protein M758_UG168900 [Ceratodon purpureus]